MDDKIAWYQNMDPVGLENTDPFVVPKKTVLYENYPNPFNPITTIGWELAAGSSVRLSIHTITGEAIALLVDEKQPAGYHSVQLDGRHLASGVYLYRLEAVDQSQSAKPGYVETKKMVLMK